MRIFCLCSIAICYSQVIATSTYATGELELSVVDADSGEPIAARIHLRDSRGRSRLPRGTINHGDHFCFEGTTVLRLPNGTYTFEIERGLEYRQQTGHFVIDQGAADNKTVSLKRFVNMQQEGWWSGDLDIRRAAAQMRTLMLAEDLHLGDMIAWPNGSEFSDEPNEIVVERFVESQTVLYEGGGGRLLFFGTEPLDRLFKPNVRTEYPSSADFLKQARKRDALIEVSRPDSKDLPMWIASGMVQSVSVLNGANHRVGAERPTANMHAPDPNLYPEAIDRTRWAHDIFYHLLNCGFRLPPTASSGSGWNISPPGYNRTYVYCGDGFTPQRWWQGLREGKVIITNGPMLRLRVNGELPGHNFTADAGASIELQTSLQLSTREKIDYLEIVKNGRPLHVVRLDEFAKSRGRLPVVMFSESGWMMIRAVTNNTEAYRYAASAPFYVDIGKRPRISRSSAEFFLNWAKQRAESLEIADENQRRHVLRYHQAAVKFWEQQVSAATHE